MDSKWDEFKEFCKHTYHSNNAKSQRQGQKFESSNRKKSLPLASDTQ